MKYWLLLIFILNPLFARAQLCEPDVSSCSFYLCQEQEHRCGPRGYPVGFGFKFCQLFLNTEKNYSNEAYGWLRRVRVCLMDSMNEIVSRGRKSCDQIKDEGFRSHLGCYIDTGFCDLSLRDQWKISWAMRTSFIHREVIRDGLSVMQACASNIRTEPNLEALGGQK